MPFLPLMSWKKQGMFVLQTLLLTGLGLQTSRETWCGQTATNCCVSDLIRVQWKCPWEWKLLEVPEQDKRRRQRSRCAAPHLPAPAQPSSTCRTPSVSVRDTPGMSCSENQLSFLQESSPDLPLHLKKNQQDCKGKTKKWKNNLRNSS